MMIILWINGGNAVEISNDCNFKRISKLLKKERIRQHMTISRLSLLSGVSATEIRRYEKCYINLSLETLIRVVFVLEIDINQLFPNAYLQDYACKRFEQLVKNLDIKKVNFILNTVTGIVQYNKRML